MVTVQYGDKVVTAKVSLTVDPDLPTLDREFLAYREESHRLAQAPIPSWWGEWDNEWDNLWDEDE